LGAKRERCTGEREGEDRPASHEAGYEIRVARGMRKEIRVARFVRSGMRTEAGYEIRATCGMRKEIGVARFVRSGMRTEAGYEIGVARGMRKEIRVARFVRSGMKNHGMKGVHFRFVRKTKTPSFDAVRVSGIPSPLTSIAST
jgi:hypothetical protein